jgi:hypothetical protein
MSWGTTRRRSRLTRVRGPHRVRATRDTPDGPRGFRYGPGQHPDSRRVTISPSSRLSAYRLDRSSSTVQRDRSSRRLRHLSGRLLRRAPRTGRRSQSARARSDIAARPPAGCAERSRRGRDRTPTRKLDGLTCSKPGRDSAESSRHSPASLQRKRRNLVLANGAGDVGVAGGTQAHDEYVDHEPDAPARERAGGDGVRG